MFALLVLLLLVPASLEIHHSCHPQQGPPHAGDASSLRQGRGGWDDSKVHDLCTSCALLRTLLSDGKDRAPCDVSPVYSPAAVPAVESAARDRSEGVPRPRGPPLPPQLPVA